MKKIIFTLMALVCSMSMSAQTIKVMKGNNVVATYTAAQADHVVFEPDFVVIEADYDNNPSTPDTKLKWAKKNVGAATEKDWGDYFAWGETTLRYTSYTRNPATNESSFEGWKTNAFYGWPSYNESTLDPAHDAATANLGGNWRTPSYDEFVAMQKVTKWTYIAADKGYYVTAKDVNLDSDKSNALLFFPFTGYFIESQWLQYGGQAAYYWTSTHKNNSANDVWCLDITMVPNPSVKMTNIYRSQGAPVRPVSE